MTECPKTVQSIPFGQDFSLAFLEEITGPFHFMRTRFQTTPLYTLGIDSSLTGTYSV